MPPRVGRVGDGNGPREWLEALPPITRAWLLGSLVSTTLLSFGMLDGARLIWVWPLVAKKFEIWRLVTPFLFWGGFSFPFVINMFVLVQYSRNYEIAPYDTGGGGSTADYAWMLILGGALLLVMATFLQVMAPSQGLTYLVMYVWSRRNPTTPVSLYGFQLQAVYLPWALLAFNLVIGNDLTAPLMGVASGHCFYFCVDAFPLNYGYDIITTPRFIIDLFSGGGPPRPGRGYTATAPPARRGDQQQQQPPRGGGGGLFQRRPGGGGGHNWGTGRQLGAE